MSLQRRTWKEFDMKNKTSAFGGYYIFLKSSSKPSSEQATLPHVLSNVRPFRCSSSFPKSFASQILFGIPGPQRAVVRFLKTYNNHQSYFAENDYLVTAQILYMDLKIF